MGPPRVVKVQITADRSPRLADRAVGVQIDFLVFDRSPKSLDHDVVAPRASAIHADGDFLAQQHAGESVGRELA